MVLLLFKCGCRIERRKGTKLIKLCPDHGEPLINKIYFCQDCDKEIVTKYTTNFVRRCPTCKIKHHAVANKKHKEKMRTAYWQNKQNKFSNLKSLKRKPDCRYYEKCLAIDGLLMENEKACFNCKRYTKKTEKELLESLLGD